MLWPPWPRFCAVFAFGWQFCTLFAPSTPPPLSPAHPQLRAVYLRELTRQNEPHAVQLRSLVACGLLQYLVAVLDAHSEDPRLCAEACAALANLASGAYTAVKGDIAAAGAVQTWVLALLCAVACHRCCCWLLLLLLLLSAVVVVVAFVVDAITAATVPKAAHVVYVGGAVSPTWVGLERLICAGRGDRRELCTLFAPMTVHTAFGTLIHSPLIPPPCPLAPHTVSLACWPGMWAWRSAACRRAGAWATRPGAWTTRVPLLARCRQCTLLPLPLDKPPSISKYPPFCTHWPPPPSQEHSVFLRAKVRVQSLAYQNTPCPCAACPIPSSPPGCPAGSPSWPLQVVAACP